MKTNWAALRESLLKRCSGYCEKCGRPLGDDWAAHHRKLKKHGGPDTLPNLVALHHNCHNLGTTSIHLNPKNSYDTGFLVKSWNDPNNTPITLHGNKTVLLTLDGRYEDMP